MNAIEATNTLLYNLYNKYEYAFRLIWLYPYIKYEMLFNLLKLIERNLFS